MQDTKELNELLNKLKEEGCLVIVEGKKDKKALLAEGIRRVKIIDKPFYKIVDEIDEKEVAILTDLDNEGKRIYGILRNDLQKKGVKVNNKLRNFLFKTSLRHIEGLTRYRVKNGNRKGY